MSGAAHTPGPWSVDLDSFTGFRNRVRASAKGGGGRDNVCIADVQPAITNDVREANARLIAAAPDLLEALEAIFAKQDRGEGAPGHSHDVRGIWDADNAPGVAGTRCEWCGQWEAARAAIAKARGQ